MFPCRLEAKVSLLKVLHAAYTTHLKAFIRDSPALIESVAKQVDDPMLNRFIEQQSNLDKLGEMAENTRQEIHRYSKNFATTIPYVWEVLNPFSQAWIFEDEVFIPKLEPGSNSATSKKFISRRHPGLPCLAMNLKLEKSEHESEDDDTETEWKLLISFSSLISGCCKLTSLELVLEEVASRRPFRHTVLLVIGQDNGSGWIDLRLDQVKKNYLTCFDNRSNMRFRIKLRECNYQHIIAEKTNPDDGESDNDSESGKESHNSNGSESDSESDRASKSTKKRKYSLFTE